MRWNNIVNQIYKNIYYKKYTTDGSRIYHHIWGLEIGYILKTDPLISMGLSQWWQCGWDGPLQILSRINVFCDFSLLPSWTLLVLISRARLLPTVLLLFSLVLSLSPPLPLLCTSAVCHGHFCLGTCSSTSQGEQIWLCCLSLPNKARSCWVGVGSGASALAWMLVPWLSHQPSMWMD